MPGAEEVARQPNSRMCFVCGLENAVGLRLRFVDNGRDEVRVECSLPDTYQGYPGVVHGGVLAAILDEVAGRTSMIGDHNHFMVTASMKVDYRKPVPTGTPLTFIGRMIGRQGRRAEAHSEVRLPDGTLAAEASVLLAELPKSLFDVGQTERFGWRVYPDESSDPSD
jgi:uncharacterized protein (TIGR00369 family)